MCGLTSVVFRRAGRRFIIETQNGARKQKPSRLQKEYLLPEHGSALTPGTSYCSCIKFDAMVGVDHPYRKKRATYGQYCRLESSTYILGNLSPGVHKTLLVLFKVLIYRKNNGRIHLTVCLQQPLVSWKVIELRRNNTCECIIVTKG